MNTDTFSKANQNSIPITVIVETYGAAMGIVIVACRVHFGTATINDLNQLLKNRLESLPKATLLSRLHRIRPVVYRVLLEAAIPGEIKEQLKNELHAITLQNFAIAQEAERIVNRLELHNLSAIPYKGVAFSKQFYGDISMRESSDIDLIIDKEKIESLIELFKQDGFEISYLQTPPNGQDSYFIKNKDFCFDKKTSQTNWHIELHWMITHPSYSAPTLVNKFQIPTVTSSLKSLNHLEHFRAILLHHMVHDGIEYLKNVVDLAQALLFIKKQSQSEQLANHLEPLSQYYHLAAIGNAIDRLFGINAFELGISSNKQIRITKKIVSFNLRSTIGKLKRHQIISLVQHYFHSSVNRARCNKKKKDQLLFLYRYWLSIIKPQPLDKSIIKLPLFLNWLYFPIRFVRILLRKRNSRF